MRKKRPYAGICQLITHCIADLLNRQFDLPINRKDWFYRKQSIADAIKETTLPEINRFVARSISQYLEIVENLCKCTDHALWFRGHSRNSYRLVPGVLRETKMITDGLGRKLQKGDVVNASGGEVTGPSAEQMLAEFKQKARPFIGELPQNEFEWMFLAQHYSLPTRLIDWSTNALVGLYFAASGASTVESEAEGICDNFLEGDDSEDNGFAVFVMDPIQINQEAVGLSDLIDVARNFEKWDHYIDPMAHSDRANTVPLCVTAPQNSPRIRAQSGVFTLHGSNIWALDYYEPLRPHISKIFFPNSVSEQILDNLSRLGMNRTFIYPGLDSVAIDVRTRHFKKYRAEFEGW